MMNLTPDQLVQQIHDTPNQVVLAVSGGGSRAIADLLEVPGASRTLLEAIVPYSMASMEELLRGTPEEFCSSRTARLMAMASFHRASRYHASHESLAGVACTASLASDRPKRGPHRIHVALQNTVETATWFIELLKDRRSRAEEERLTSRLLLNTVAQACGVSARLSLDLLDGETLHESSVAAPQSWSELLLGKVESVRLGKHNGATPAIFPGAFNPFHAAHCRMVQLAQEHLQQPVALEISILNVDKPPLDFMEIENRIIQFGLEQPVFLTRSATFEEKSALFPGAVFVVGMDTLQRIAASRYYGNSETLCQEALRRIAERGCRFLVFVRAVDGCLTRLADLSLPEPLKSICTEIPPEIFREDISSTALRQAGVAK